MTSTSLAVPLMSPLLTLAGVARCFAISKRLDFCGRRLILTDSRLQALHFLSHRTWASDLPLCL